MQSQLKYEGGNSCIVKVNEDNTATFDKRMWKAAKLQVLLIVNLQVLHIVSNNSKIKLKRKSASDHAVIVLTVGPVKLQVRTRRSLTRRRPWSHRHLEHPHSRNTPLPPPAPRSLHHAELC